MQQLTQRGNAMIHFWYVFKNVKSISYQKKKKGGKKQVLFFLLSM